MANPAVAPLTSLPPTRSGSSSEIDPKPAAQRDRAGASVGTSTTYSPRAFSAKAQLIPTFPASAGPIPRSPPTNPSSAAGPGRSEHWNVHHLLPSRLQRESPTHPHVPCERRTDPAEPTHKPVKRSGTGPKRALERLPPKPLAPSARKPHSSPRSLRTQDRSREAHPQTHPPMLAF